MDDTPKCEKCGLEITTGMMPALCQYARECVMWPHSDGTPDGDGAELLMAKWWMDTACEQIGHQIEERKKIAAYAVALKEAGDALAGYVESEAFIECDDGASMVNGPMLEAVRKWRNAAEGGL